MRRINPKWTERVTALLDGSQAIDETSGFLSATQWLVIQLTKRDRPFRIHNLGAGVRRITTDTETCPCCKRELATGT